MWQISHHMGEHQTVQGVYISDDLFAPATVHGTPHGSETVSELLCNTSNGGYRVTPLGPATLRRVVLAVVPRGGLNGEELAVTLRRLRQLLTAAFALAGAVVLTDNSLADGGMARQNISAFMKSEGFAAMRMLRTRQLSVEAAGFYAVRTLSALDLRMTCGCHFQPDGSITVPLGFGPEDVSMYVPGAHALLNAASSTDAAAAEEAVGLDEDATAHAVVAAVASADAAAAAVPMPAQRAVAAAADNVAAAAIAATSGAAVRGSSDGDIGSAAAPTPSATMDLDSSLGAPATSAASAAATVGRGARARIRQQQQAEQAAAKLAAAKRQRREEAMATLVPAAILMSKYYRVDQVVRAGLETASRGSSGAYACAVVGELVHLPRHHPLPVQAPDAVLWAVLRRSRRKAAASRRL